MAQHISPEQKAKIISAVKDDGMSISDAAKTFLVSEFSLKKWLRRQTKNAHTSSTEVQKLKEEVRALKEIIGDIVLAHKLKRKSPFVSS